MRDAYKTAMLNPPKAPDNSQDTSSQGSDPDSQLQSAIDSIGSPHIGQIGPNIRRLQVALRTLGYFPYKDTAIFGEKTQDALTAYQKDHGLVADVGSTDSTSTPLSPATKEAMTLDLIALVHTGKADINTLTAS